MSFTDDELDNIQRTTMTRMNAVMRRLASEHNCGFEYGSDYFRVVRDGVALSAEESAKILALLDIEHKRLNQELYDALVAKRDALLGQGAQ